MTLIGENIHIISPSIKEAIINKDDNFILDLVKKQVENGISTLDLNVGPSKAKLEGALSYLINLIQNNFDVNFSLDTTNFEEMRKGFNILKNSSKSFLNSTSAISQRLEYAAEFQNLYNCNLIALTMNEEGIPSTADERLELAFEIIDGLNSSNVDNSKIYFDPLVLPVCVRQNQALVALDTIRMIKESFDDVKTIIGLSNISNGAINEFRPLINRVFLVLALGYGLDSAIIDGRDKEIINLCDRVKKGSYNTQTERLYLDLFDMAQTFGSLKDIKYDKNNIEEKNIYLTAQILLNEEIYSPSYLQKEIK